MLGRGCRGEMEGEEGDGEGVFGINKKMKSKMNGFVRKKTLVSE